MKKDDILSLKNRRILYSFIERYPAVSLHEIVRKLNLPVGTVKYHLDYLKDRGILKIEKVDGYTRYYLKNKFGKDETKLLNVLKIKTCRLILLYLLVNFASSRKKLGDHLDKHPSTIFHYLKKLRKLDIIEPTKNKYNIVQTSYRNIFMKFKSGDRDVFFTLKDPYIIYDLFIVYQNRLFDDDIINSLLDVYNYFKDENKDIYSSKNKDIIMLEIDIVVNRLEDNFYKLFPIPFLS